MLLSLVLLGCDPDMADPHTFAPLTDPDGATLDMDDAGLVWTQADGTAHRLNLWIIETETPDWAHCAYDPWWLYDERDAAGNLATAGFEADLRETCDKGLDIRTSTDIVVEDDNLRVTFEGGREAEVRLEATGPGLRLTVKPATNGEDVPYVGIDVGATADEVFYGLGEHFDSELHRGRVRAMQIELDIARESTYNEAHVPVPLLVSSASWGMLVDSFRPMVFDVAATRPDVVSVLVQNVDEVSIDLYAPPSPGAVTGRYWQRTGAPEIPPDWAFAPLHWRNEVGSETDVLDDARTMRELGLPTGVMWVDNPWQSSYNSMQPDPAQFPNWDAMVDELHGLGFRFMAWTTPYVEETDPEHTTYADNGWFVEGPQLFSTFGDIVDLTNPDAAAAWAGRVSAAKDRGIEGWKLDYGEDVQLGAMGARIAPAWTFDNGADERTMHHQFATFYHTPYVTPYAEAGVLLGRGGCKGGQTVTDVIWPGDLDNGLQRWGDEADGDLLVGGLPSAIHGGSSLSVSGYPFFASDTGGYRGGRPTAESFVRWMEYAATLPIWQYGGAGENHNPWDFTDYGESHFDTSTLAAFARYATLHTRLFPYYQAAVAVMLETGVPVVLPQGLGDPEAGVHDELDYFVGNALFVGPVVDPGASSWTGTLPTGRWVHWWTGEAYDGGKEVTIDAPLGEGPLFVRVGSVVPMLRRTIQTLAPATDPRVDSWANDPGVLNGRVLPGAGATATVADGAMIEAPDLSAITLTPGTDYVGWDLEIYAPGATSASADGATLPVGTEGCSDCVISADPWVRVVLGAGAHTVSVP